MRFLGNCVLNVQRKTVSESFGHIYYVYMSSGRPQKRDNRFWRHRVFGLHVHKSFACDAAWGNISCAALCAKRCVESKGMCTSVEISRLLLCVILVLFKLATLREKWIVLHKEAMLHILKSIHKRHAVMFNAVQKNERLLTATRLAAKPRLKRTRRFWMLKR